MRRIRGVLLLAGLAMMAVGFGGVVSSAMADGSEVSVTLSDFRIVVDPSSAPAGEVTFNAMNISTAEEHEMVVVKTDIAHDAFSPRADNPNQVDEDAAGEVIGEIEPDDLQPGSSASATFNLEEGAYVLLCNVPGHYQLGMHVAFTVKEAEGAAPEAEATTAPEVVSPPATGSGGLLDSDSGSNWGFSALAIGGVGLVLLGLLGIRSRGRV